MKSRWVDGFILALGLIVLTFGIGDYGFYEPHEGHFGGVGYEMLRRGDWVTPTLNGAPYLNKPPLLYWLVASSYTLFGVTEWAARLPLALAGWLGTIIAWKWARELWGVEAGRTAAAMLSVTLGWFIFTHQLLIDILLATLVLGSYYSLWRLLWTNSWRYFFGLYSLLGLCVLAKGLLGIVLPLLGCIGVAVSRRSGIRIRFVQGTAVSLAVILPWFIAVERANPGFLVYFFYNEHFQRLFDNRWPPDYEVSKVGALGYLAIAAVWCLPWTLLLPSVIRSTWRDWRKGHRRQREGILLLVIAALSPILLFLPLSSRLVYYSLPAVPPYVILCAGWWSNKTFRAIAVGIFVILGLAVSSAAVWAPHLVMKLPHANNSSLGWLITSVALSIGLSCLLAGIQYNRSLSLAVIWIGFASAYLFVVRGFVLHQNVRSSKTLIDTATPCLSTALWTFEGSRELGTAGAMAYYLNRQSSSNPSISSADRHLPPGWVRGKDKPYRIVMVLSDGGSNRILPQFPGSPPEYAITQEELQQYWNSPHPVVFITDFMRQPNDPGDPPDLNLPDQAGKPLLIVGSRRLYGNAAARKLWCK